MKEASLQNEESQGILRAEHLAHEGWRSSYAGPEDASRCYAKGVTLRRRLGAGYFGFWQTWLRAS